MSEDSIISDTGDINEGEGAKIVQSSIMTQSIMKPENPSKLLKPPVIKDPKKNDANFSEPLKIAPNSTKVSKAPIEFKSSSFRLKKSLEIQMVSPQFSKNSHQKSVAESFRTPKINFIPVLNKDTTNPNTFDLNFLLHPDVQKIAKSGHRLTQSNTVSNTGSFVNNKSHIQKNIKSTRSLYNSVSSKNFQDVGKAKKLSIDVDERFYKKAKKTEEKVKFLKDIKDMEEINNCTFHPKIKTKRKTKTCEEYFDYMKTFTDKKEKKVSKLREEGKKAYDDSIDFNHQPKICEKSVQIMAQKASIETNTFERLHKFFKYKGNSCETVRDLLTVDSNINDTHASFQPKVNKRSQGISRPEPVDKLLYKDAIRRQKRKLSMPTAKTPKLITIHSEKVLIDKLKRDFENSFCQVDIDNTEILNYTKMIEMFRTLNMVQDSNKREEERLLLLETWKMTANENSQVRKIDILCFVLAVMGFHEEWMLDPDYTNLTVTPFAATKMHQKFCLFYTNRTTAQHKFSTSRAGKGNDENPSRVQTSALGRGPLTCRASMRFEGKLEDYLIAEKERVAQKIEEKRILLNEEQMEECSFHPLIEPMPESSKISRIEKEDLASEYFKQLNSPDSTYTHRGLFLHDLSKAYKDKKQEIANFHREKELKKELEVCTFAPKLEKRVFPEDPDQIPEKKPKKKKILCLTKKVPEKPRKSLDPYPGRNFSSDLQKPVFKQNEKLMEEPKSKENLDNFFTLVKCMKGIATILINTSKSKETIEFNFKEEDPACVVLDFSSRYGLNKDQEYKLVKELTLIKYKNL